jgi:hypothetical protein
MKRILPILLILVCLCSCAPQFEITQTARSTPTVTEPASLPLLRVAYSKNAEPWIWTEGEGPRQLMDTDNVMEVHISSDGLVIAFKREDTGEVFAVNADGSGLHNVVSAEFLEGKNATVWIFDFAPGTHSIYFTLAPRTGNFAPYYDLHRVDADTNTPTPSLVRAPGQGGIVAFSPDGQWMTLYHGGGIDLVRADGGESRAIFSSPPEGYEPVTLDPGIVWRLDSSGFSLFHVNAVWFIPITGGDPVLSPTLPILWGAISPDGQRVAYMSPGNPSEIHIFEVDATDTLYDTVENSSFGGWLPDSEHFTIIVDVVIEGFYGMAKQYYIGALGEDLTRLTDTDDAYPVVWLSNERFLFVGMGELHIQTVGEASVLLDENVYNIFDYAWVTP